MHIARKVLASSLSAALLFGFAGTAEAAPTPNIGTVIAPDSFEPKSDGAESLVAQKMGNGAAAVELTNALVSNAIPEEFAAQADADTVQGKVSTQDGTVSLAGDQGQGAFAVGLVGSTSANVVGGVADIKTTDESLSGVSHATPLGGQVVAVIANPGKSYVDFNLSIPVGYSLKKTGEAFSLVADQTGAEMGAIGEPWAVDAKGSFLPTHYELLGHSTLRQHIDTRTATFPISADPSWWWWTKTVTSCAGALAPLVALGGSALAAKIPKLVNAISKATKAKKIASAVQEAGGVKEAAALALKTAVNALRSKLPGGIQKAMPSFNLGAKAGAGLAIYEFLWNQIWDFLGIGSRGALVKELIH